MIVNYDLNKCCNGNGNGNGNGSLNTVTLQLEKRDYSKQELEALLTEEIIDGLIDGSLRVLIEINDDTIPDAFIEEPEEGEL